MNKLPIKKEMVSKNKNKVILCSTPEHRSDSPSRDSDSICDSEAASPVPFLCTQDGAEGETDVVWNFYTPSSKHIAKSNNNTTPLSRKSKRSRHPKLIEKAQPKRKGIKPLQKNNELFQELLELKQNLHEFIPKKTPECARDRHSGSEDDIFINSQEYSPKSGRRLSSNCLRKNLLSSNFSKPDPDTALESDDSMNECLLKASQMVEEVILKKDLNAQKRSLNVSKTHINKRDINADVKLKIDHDSMDAILNSIQLDSPVLKKFKCDSVRFNNDSFDNLVGNLNESALEMLTQVPVPVNGRCKTTEPSNEKVWSIKEFVVCESPSKSAFGRYNSMPESPSVHSVNKPSSSGMSFGRFNSMPHGNDGSKIKDADLSPVRCTPEEIKKKHQLAKEKLMARRLLPFTSTQSTQNVPATNLVQTFQSTQSKNVQFKLKIPSPRAKMKNDVNTLNKVVEEKSRSKNVDIKSIIEKKRQEALLRLRKRQPHSKQT